MDILYVVMPAYNEEENIEKTIREWYPVVERHNGGGRSRLVIFNDGSKDRTYEKGLAMMEEFPLLEMKSKANSGHGPTLLRAYEYAIRSGADYVFQTDSDGQTDPKEFEAFWKARKKYDGIFGVRVKRGDGKQRAFVERVVCLLLRLYFGVRIPDANAPFRLMKAEVLEKYLKKLPEDYNLPNIMLTTYFSYYKEKTAFHRISFKPRTAGTHSLNARRIARIGWNALGDFARLRKEMKGQCGRLGGRR
ncbi:MAG: glycosyltransferase family 2 protein [Eubacteriales bacterium]|nr:glycosyltransferase family 2 protein [Eubacteriales bacterium]